MTYPMGEIDLETPEVDAAEQSMIAAPSWQDHDAEEGISATAEAISATAEASEWDRQEQGRTVEFDDDYR
ncbi:hypothetical protein [Actinoplanes sp. GCM10030250]|uniref:hypothetical protein n=1 Tax=Actinoplanes sp. GCM10030250 TaxID=3273376 RepID=UPI00361F9F3B